MCDDIGATKSLIGIAPFDNNTLPDFVLQKSAVELNETPENKKNGLQELKQRIKVDKDINSIDFHEDFLVQYLRRHKYNINGAFKQLRNYVAFRKKEAKLFQTIEDGCFIEGRVKSFIKILPYRCPDGCPVIHVRFGEWHSDKLPLEDLKRLAIMMLLQLFRDPMTQINGIKTIYDFQGTSFHHLKLATFDPLYLYYNLLINCFPGRYKAVHAINESVVMKAIWVICKQLLPEKILKRVYFHSKPEDLLDYFPRYMIPVEYGGELVESDVRDWLRTVNKEHTNNSLNGQPNFY